MPCSPLSFSMRSVQIPCRFFPQVIDSAYLCRTCIDNTKILCCLFIVIYYIVVILSEAEGSAVVLRYVRVGGYSITTLQQVQVRPVLRPDRPLRTPISYALMRPQRASPQ